MVSVTQLLIPQAVNTGSTAAVNLESPIPGQVGERAGVRHRHLVTQDQDLGVLSGMSLLRYGYLHSQHNSRKYPMLSLVCGVERMGEI